MEEVLHIMQAAYGFSVHNEACRRRTDDKAYAVIRYIWRDARELLPDVSKSRILAAVIAVDAVDAGRLPRFGHSENNDNNNPLAEGARAQ